MATEAATEAVQVEDTRFEYRFSLKHRRNCDKRMPVAMVGLIVNEDGEVAELICQRLNDASDEKYFNAIARSGVKGQPFIDLSKGRRG